MGILEQFTKFHSGLAPEDQKVVDSVLKAMMERKEADPLTPEQKIDAARRAGEILPEYATREEIDSVFGRPLPH